MNEPKNGSGKTYTPETKKVDFAAFDDAKGDLKMYADLLLCATGEAETTLAPGTLCRLGGHVMDCANTLDDVYTTLTGKDGGEA